MTREDKSLKYPTIHLSSMSASYTTPFVIDGYGLREEDLNEIIIMERLKDISQGFSRDIHKIQEKFDSKSKIRVIEFNELSGADVNSNSWFRRLIFARRHIFFNTISSNKDCCVIFFYAGRDKKDKMLSERFLPHEFAHHFQWASEGFPCLLPKGTPKKFLPQFAKCYEIGPKVGSVYVDNIFLDDNLIFLIKDFSERIADFVCEGILKEKGFRKGYLEEYCLDRNRDPAKNFPIQLRPKLATAIRYMRRLALRDAAEWHAILRLAYPNDRTLKKMLDYDRKYVLHLNKKYGKAKRAFKQIYEISLNTDHNSFKNVRNAVRYIKEIMDLLGIIVKTKESW